MDPFLGMLGRFGRFFEDSLKIFQSFAGDLVGFLGILEDFWMVLEIL